MIRKRCLPSFSLMTFAMLLYSAEIIASTADTTLPELPTIIRIYTEKDWETGNPPAGLDTGFSELNAPDPVLREDGQHLGVIGSPAKANWNNQPASIFNWCGWTQYDDWLIRPDNTRYYRTNKRLTRADYHMASFREQTIEVFHSQNIIKNWNAGIRFKRMNVKDFLPRSDTYLNRFHFFTDYGSKNGRYHVFATATWNAFKNQLNGGIPEDTLFIGQNVSNRDLRGLQVNLSNAGNRFREKSFRVAHYFRIDRPADSARFQPQLYFSSTFVAGSSTYFDDENDTIPIYDQYFNGLSSYDSAGYKDWRNKGGLDLRFKLAGSQLRISPYAEHQQLAYRISNDSSVNNLSAGAVLQYSSTRFLLSGSHQRLISGAAKGNNSSSIRLTYNNGKWMTALEAGTATTSVPLLYNEFSSNHLRWRNDFTSPTVTHAAISLKQMAWGLELEASTTRTSGYLYMNRLALPEQFSGSVEIRRFTLIKNFRLDNWHLDNRIRYQQVSDNEVLHLPALSLRHSLYWERDLLRKAVILTAGLRFRYQSAYEGDRFMPASGFYFLQDTVTTSGQPLFDLFTDFRIKGATIYLAAENILQPAVTSPYFLTPSYPQPGMTFRFGIRWFFLDQ